MTLRTNGFRFLVEVGDFVRHVVGEGWWKILFGGWIRKILPKIIEMDTFGVWKNWVHIYYPFEVKNGIRDRVKLAPLNVLTQPYWVVYTVI